MRAHEELSVLKSFSLGEQRPVTIAASHLPTP